MKKTRFVLGGFIALSLATATGQASALSLNTVFKSGTTVICSDEATNSSGVATCSDSMDVNGNIVDYTLLSRESFGDLGASGTVTVSDGRAGANGGVTAGFSVSTNILDTLTFGVDDGVFSYRLPVDILGSISAPTPPSSASGGGGVASSTFGVTVQANGIATTVYRDGIQAQTGLDVVTGLDAVGSLGITTLDIPIIDGEIDLIVSLFGVIQCSGRFEEPGAPEFGGPCSASFDFLNSARLLGGQVIDANGGVVNGINVSSISGFDYLSGVRPHNVSAVPLPAGAPLFLTALGFLAVIRMRRTKR